MATGEHHYTLSRLRRVPETSNIYKMGNFQQINCRFIRNMSFCRHPHSSADAYVWIKQLLGGNNTLVL